MPKASEEARRARRRAADRLSTAYGWPDRRTRFVVSPTVAIAVVLWGVILLTVLFAWSNGS